MTVSTETVRMAKSRPRNNQSERSDLPYHIITNLIFGFASVAMTVGYVGLAKMRTTARSNFGNVGVVCVKNFLSHPNYCYTDIQLIPLELIHASRDSLGKARESNKLRGPVLF